MQIRLERLKILELWNTIQSLNEKELDGDLVWGLMRTEAHIERLVQDLQKKISWGEDFDNRRLELIQEMAAKDTNGVPVKMSDGQYYIPDVDTFTEKLNVIIEETGNTEKAKENEEFMNGSEDIEVHSISRKLLPKKYKKSEFKGIMPMIIDEDEVKPEEMN